MAKKADNRITDNILEAFKERSRRRFREIAKKADERRMHLTGKDAEKYVKRLKNYENDQQYQIRIDTLISNRHLYASILKDVDAVFTATGGTQVIEGKQEDRIKENLSAVDGYRSLRRYVHDIVKRKYFIDPNALIFIEVDKSGKPYPTIKETSNIIYYKRIGRNADFIVFITGEKTEDNLDIYRYVDGKIDILFTYTDQDKAPRFIPDSEFKMMFQGKVPAIIIGTEEADSLDRFESMIDDGLDIAMRYMDTMSIKNVFKYLHGFPVYWQYLSSANKCKSCNGEGTIMPENAKEPLTCPDCGGNGWVLTKDVSDIIGLKPPKEDQPKLAPDIAGYVSPDINIAQEFRTDLDYLKKAIEVAFWGTMKMGEKSDTATGRYIDLQPVNDKLETISTAFEETENMYAQMIALFYGENIEKATVSLNYGNRFIIESPDALLKTYEEAKTKGINTATLNQILESYYYSKYKNNNRMLAYYLTVLRLEPYPHNTISEVMTFQTDGQTMNRKRYFYGYVNSESVSDIVSMKPERFYRKLDNYIETKNDFQTEIE